MVSSFRTHSAASSKLRVVMGAHAGSRILVVDDSPTLQRVVVRILNNHGYRADAASDGELALDKLRSDGPYDLVLLDFVMPRMNGYQFCRELRSDRLLKKTPVILMSARAHVIGDRFVEQTGAADALSKPFDARALVAVVGSVLARLEESTLDADPEFAELLTEDDFEAVEDPPPSQRDVSLILDIARNVAQAISPHLRELDADALQQPQLVEDAILAGLNNPTVAGNLRGLVENLDLRSMNGLVLRGEIGHIPLAEILQVLQLRRQTGVLKASQGASLGSIYIREGQVDMVQHENMGDEFLVGRYVVTKGWLDRQTVEAEVNSCNGQKLFGQWLLEKSLLSQEQLDEALQTQSRELAYELIRWNEGSYRLYNEDFSEEAKSAGLGLSMSELVLEGYRRVDEWRHMSDAIDFNAVMVIDQVALEKLGDSKVNSIEKRILEQVDGDREVRALIEASNLAPFDAIKALYQLKQSRILRELS